MELMANGIRYHIEVTGEEERPVLVLLHGFTGSTATWHPVFEYWQDFRVVAIDLIGHGKTDSPKDAKRYTMERQLEDLESIFQELKLNQFSLLGYSMGGRTALAYACEYSDRVGRLLLESASPGLELEADRKQRQEADARLAQDLLRDGLDAFVAKWENISLFDSQKSLPQSVREQVRQERLAQSELGLSNSLLGMGTGSQRSYWDRLEDLKMPVMLLTGELDLKFYAIALRMQELLPNAEHRIISAGHAIHVEKPAEFATMVMEQLIRINEED